MALLVGGEDVGDDLLAAQPHAAGDGLGRHAVVAGEHAHVDAELAERSDGLGARLFDLVSHGDGADKLAVLGKEQRRLAFGGKLLGKTRGHGNAQLVHQAHVAGCDDVLPLACGDTATGRGGKVLDHARDDSARLALGHNRLGQRVLARALQRGGQLEQRLFAHGGRAVSARGYHDIGHGRLAAGDGARLIEHHGAHAAQVLQRLGALEQNAHLGALAGANHNGDGRGQAQRARTTDHQHSHGGGKRFVDASGQHHPRHKSYGRDYKHHGHEHAGDLVGHAGDGRLGGVGVLDELDNLGERCLGTHPRGAEGKRTGAVDGGGVDGVAGGLFHGDRLAGERTLVQGRAALEHHAIDGDGLSGAHAQDLAGKDTVDVDGGFGAVVGNDGRSLGCQVDERLDSAAGFGFAACLEVFAHSDERQDRARTLKIQVVHARHHGLVDLPGGQLVGHDKHGIERPGDRRGGADGDESVHGRRAVRERFKPVDKVRVVDVDDGDEQDELGERERHAVGMVGENAG